jgi:hypothetical protein
MCEILDVGMYDYEYSQLIAQGRDPVQEKICERNLIRAGVSPDEAHQVAPLFKKLKCSIEEEALVRKAWMQVLG